MGTIVSASVGGLLAVVVGLLLVSALGGETATPVDTPYIVYGQS